MFKLFEVFGELSMQGAEAAASVMSKAEEQGKGLADSLESIGKSASKVGDSMSKKVTGPILAVGGALTALAFNAISTGDDLAKFSRSVGIGVESLQEYEFALGRIAGVSEGQTRKALEFMNRTLADGTQGNEKAIETFTKLGFSMEDIKNGAIGTEDAMDAALEAIRNASSEAEAQAIAMDIFGKKQGIALANNIRESAETVEDAREIFRREVGGMTQEQAEMAEKANDAWDLFKRSVSSATMQIGAELLPMFVQIVESMQEKFIPAVISATQSIVSMVQWFTDLNPAVQASIGIFIGLIAAVGPILSIGGRLIVLLTGLRKVFMLLGAAKLFAAGALGLLLSPVILVVAAIALLSAAIYYNWDRIKEWGKAIAQFASGAWESLKEWGSRVIDMFRELPKVVGRAIASMVTNVVSRIRSMVSDSLAALRNLYREAVGNSIIPDLAKDVISEVGHMADDSIGETKRMSKGMLNNMMDSAPSGLRGSPGYHSGKGATTSVVNLQHAVINTEQSLDSRLPLSGHDMTGAF